MNAPPPHLSTATGPATSPSAPTGAEEDLFTRSVRSVLTYLGEHTGLPNWSVSRVTGGEQVHLHVAAESFLEVGLRVDWQDTFCRKMVNGAASLVLDSTLDPDYAHLPAVPAVRSYAGFPLLDSDGELFGTLCGVGEHPLSAAEDVDQELVHLLGNLLTSQLQLSLLHENAVAGERLARTAAEADQLTGLLNRRGWDVALTEAQHRVDTYGDLVAVLVVDLNRLKQVNDTRGHAAGDELIRAAAEGLRAGVRSGDLVARVGGDEFGVLLDGVTAEGLDARVDDLVAGLAAAGVSASVGGAVAQPGLQSLTEAVHLADRRMYAAKTTRPR